MTAPDVSVRTDFPFEVEVVEHAWVPLRDGTRLAARLWLPVAAPPVPAVLCYLPYRKSDGVAMGDDQEMRYFAGHGYAGVRLDIRGTGDSDGIITDEYSEQEQLDCLEAIDWIAAQEWCDGGIGMTGYSWGGFNALQVAARQPPALKAITTFYSSDDRYATDVHYYGGCVLALEMLHWATCMLAFNAMPPDPRSVGEGWRAQWLERLDRTPPFIEAWLSHQRRDAYWKHGSVCEHYAAIRCPVYAIGGWTDGYTDTVLRLLEGLSVPCKGLIGPWGHNDPVRGVPGPAVGILQEQVRWWDRWLRGVRNGIDEEPMLRVWLQDWIEPQPALAERPGRWAAEDTWPSPRIELRTVALGPAAPAQIVGSQLCGLHSGAWCADGHSPDLPPDQQADDARSLCLDAEALAEALAILGFAEVELDVEADRPLALVCARLCDLAPDGSSLLVSRGVLNLAQRVSRDDPEALEPGLVYAVRLRLDAAGHVFPAGHRLRVALSPTYWPFVWPSPEPVTLTVHRCTLVLPVRPPRAEDAGLPPLPDPEEPPPYPTTDLREDSGGRTTTVDGATGRAEIRFDWDMGGRTLLLPTETELDYASTVTYAIIEGDPLSARVDCECRAELARGEQWSTTAVATGTMTSTATEFHVTTGVEASESSRPVFSRHFTFAIPRDHC